MSQEVRHENYSAAMIDPADTGTDRTIRSGAPVLCCSTTAQIWSMADNPGRPRSAILGDAGAVGHIEGELAFRLFEVAPSIETPAAGELGVLHRLPGAGAVHLASALALGSQEITVAVWDKRLHAGAAAAGLALAPATLD